MAVLPLTLRARSLAVLATAVAVLVGLLGAAPPVRADDGTSPTEDLDCAGIMECLVLAFPHDSDGDGSIDTQQPFDRALEFVPVPKSNFPEDDLFTSGLYQIRLVGTDLWCITPESSFGWLTPCADLDDVGSQAWFVEPLGDGPHRAVEPQHWSPWSDSAESDHAFRLIPRRWSGWHEKECLQVSDRDGNGKITDLALGDCETGDGQDRRPNPDASLTLHQIDGAPPSGSSAEQTQDEVSERLLGAALAHSAGTCEDLDTDFQIGWCKVKLHEPVVDNGADDGSDNGDADGDGLVDDPLTDWVRPGEAAPNREPTSVSTAASCTDAVTEGETSGASPQSIYNAATTPVTTTISTSATSETSRSFTHGHSITTEFSLGNDSSFFKASFSITNSVEFGKTWTDSRTLSQDVTWTIPPRKYATAVLSTSSVELVGSWQFGRDEHDHWRLLESTHMRTPYSTSSGASSPDSMLSVYNSWSPKLCDADAPSSLRDGHTVSIENETAEGKTPIIGDTLVADVGTTSDGDDDGGDAWWHVPTAGNHASVNLRYRWYRVRSGEPAEPIPGAVGETTDPDKIKYTVTGDDVTDPDVLDRFGPYHIYVGVTDVADETRFDSLEYTSVATGGVTEGPRRVAEGHLDLEVANPDAVATKDTRVDIAASITGGDGRVDGDVTILDGEEELTTVSLGSDGSERVALPLTAGPHDLTAVYEGEGPLDGVRSSTVRTTVTAAPSTTALTARRTVTVGDKATLRADVTGAGPTPTGTVEFHDGPDSLGDPVTLDADGTATLDVPGLGVGGSRALWISYSGDDIYAGSQSEQTRQAAARAATRTRVTVPDLPTARGERTRLKSRVRAPGSDVPSGKVLFFADGRRVAAGRVNARGVAKVRTRKLPRGKSDVWARFVPRSGSPFAASRSRARTHQVRRHESRVRGQLRDKRVRKRERVQVRGRVVLPDKRRVRRLRGKIWIAYDGRRYGLKRIDRDGTFRVGMPARRLDRGRNRLEVVYRGSKRPSVAADTRRVVVRRR